MRINVLGDENSTIKNNESYVSEDGLYTLVYICAPEFYLERFNSKDNDILFTCEPDEQGMYGGIKIGTTKIDKTATGTYPTDEDCQEAFQKRYSATEDGTSTILIAYCVLKGHMSHIDRKVRSILERVGNYYHPEMKVRKSEEIKCGSTNSICYVFDANGMHKMDTSIRKIGKEYMYNLAKRDILVTLVIINAIANNLSLFDEWTRDIMKDKNIVSACNIFCNELTNYKSTGTNIVPTVWNTIKIKNNIIKDIMTNKSKCFKTTPLCVIKAIAKMIKLSNRNKKLSIAIIAKTSDDAINIVENIKALCPNINFKFTLICSYKNSNLLATLSNDNIIYLDDKTFDQINDMKFDYIIQNPPYDKTLHLDYFEWFYNIQKKNKGKMIIIQPDSIFVDIREAKDRKKNSYRARQIKAMLDNDKSVSKLIIENYNYDFMTNAYYPHSITFVDFSKKHETIDFCCYGYHKTITSIQNESNPFGDLRIIETIIKKVSKAFPDKMSKHIAKSKDKYPKGTCFLKYADIIGASGGGFAGSYGGSLQKAPALSDAGKFTSIYGDFVTGYLAPNCHPTNNKIETSMIYSNNANDGSKGNKKIDNVFGTRTELKNWIENSTNNIILLFINIVYTWDQHNHTKQMMPWMADKVYSMKESFSKCAFTKEECEFIVKVVLMYRRDGAYFRRFLLGTNKYLVDALRNLPANLVGKGIPADVKNTIKVETDSDISNYIKQCEKEAQEYVKGRR